MQLVFIVLSSLLLRGHATSRPSGKKFPPNFLFGTSTAAYQIEGAWDEDGKSENIWDRLTHSNPSLITDGLNGDIAADSYHNYKRDVEMMRELGLDAYRLSLSWSRILPSGFPDHINQAGLDYYNNVINEMLMYNIQPMVTIYHWDLPQTLQDLGGFANPLFVQWFEDYAAVAFDKFGDRVKLWITFNEPREICYSGYGITYKAPVLNSTGIGDYLCAKHLVMAHAKAYHLYRKEFSAEQGGQVGITASVQWFKPATDSVEDKVATELTLQANWAIYIDPIYSKDGGFPRELATRVQERSAAQGFLRSPLPEFTEEEIVFISGSSDFFGINHYTAYVVTAVVNDNLSLDDDLSTEQTFQLDEWPQSASDWLRLAPNSLYNAVTGVTQRYGNISIYITEGGWSNNGGLEDDDRITYYRAALEDALDLLAEKVDLKGYMAWSLMDNFEWTWGYTQPFGLYAVDFESPNRTRIPRKSAFVYKHIISTRTIDPDYEPGKDRVMTIVEGH